MNKRIGLLIVVIVSFFVVNVSLNAGGKVKKNPFEKQLKKIEKLRVAFKEESKEKKKVKLEKKLDKEMLKLDKNLEKMLKPLEKKIDKLEKSIDKLDSEKFALKIEKLTASKVKLEEKIKELEKLALGEQSKNDKKKKADKVKNL